MTEENKTRVYESLSKMEALAPSIVAMIDTLAKISKEFSDGRFEGDYVVKEAGRYLLGATAHLESASAGMLSKLQECKALIEKQELEDKQNKED